MRDFKLSCVAVLFMAALTLPLAWIFGFTADGLLDNHWPRIDDHPTNWYDTTDHPDSR